MIEDHLVIASRDIGAQGDELITKLAKLPPNDASREPPMTKPRGS
jgi:hypothetical protein